MDIDGLSPGELLSLYRKILRALRDQQVIRSDNAPTGDYAEFLVQRATGGELADASQKSWDVRTPEQHRLQVKARVMKRQLSPFRTWDFDAAVVVLFDGDFRVLRASRIPVAVLKARARYSKHVNGHIVSATDELLGHPDNEDWTERLRQFE